MLTHSDHSEHCRNCKIRVYELLSAIYGACRLNHSFPWPANPEAYKNTVIGDVLLGIWTGLKDLRGYDHFVKSSQVPPCDFCLLEPPFILEFDESQHFTRARHVTLSYYRPELKIGFPLEQWKELCLSIDAKDEEPPDRDERRAWYDTLRDLVPALHGFYPTVRIYAKEFLWCSLESKSKEDRETFRSLLRYRLPGEGA